MSDRGLQELRRWLNDRVGKQLFVADVLFYLVRYCGFSLKSSRRMLIYLLETYADSFTIWRTSEGVIDGANLNGTQGHKRCLEWGALHLHDQPSWYTHFNVLNLLPELEPLTTAPPEQRKRHPKASYTISFRVRSVQGADVVQDMARYANAFKVTEIHDVITFTRSRPFGLNVIERAESLGWQFESNG